MIRSLAQSGIGELVESEPFTVKRSFDNDDLLPKIRKPVLITHGAADAIVKPVVVDQHKAAMPHAQVQVIANTGHAAFWDDAEGFNERLRAFCESL